MEVTKDTATNATCLLSSIFMMCPTVSNCITFYSFMCGVYKLEITSLAPFESFDGVALNPVRC